MAKLSSSRQSEGTPQETAARTTRSTRSASRGPSEPGTSQRGKKAGTSKRGRGGKAKVDGRDLEPVTENQEIEEQLQAENLADQQDAALEELHNRRVSTAHSVMSGTTAKTSFSQEEISELDSEVIVDVLPNMAAAADELSKLLAPVDPKARAVVPKEVRTQGTRHNKLFLNRLASLNVHKHSFGSTDYIQPSIVLRALLGVQNMRDVPQGSWRPDCVIYKINLAQMLKSMLIDLPGNGNNEITVEGYNAIETLDVNFASAIAGPIFRENALQLCLAILTQLTIIRLSFYVADINFVPSEMITNTFFRQDENGEPVFRHRNVLHLHTLPEEDQALLDGTIQESFNQLISTFEDDKAEAWMRALGELRAQHPWDQFVNQVMQYYFDRKQDLDSQIAVAGGTEEIMLGLAAEVDKRSAARNAELKRQSFSRPSGTPKKTSGKGGIARLKARERQLAAANPVPIAPMTQQQAQVAAEPIVNDGWQQPDDDVQISQAQSTARSTLEAMSGLQELQRERASKGKGRSFIDPQPGATRVTFDDTQPQVTQYQLPEFQYPSSSAPERGPYFQSPRRSNLIGKRPFSAVDDNNEDFDPTQDQGFEVDPRDHVNADANRRQVAFPPTSTAPRFSSQPSFLESPSKRQRKNPGSSIPPPTAPFDPDNFAELPRASRYDHAKIAARHGTVTAPNRKLQVRTPWSSEEENALIDLIEEEGAEGISYSKLKAQDALGPNRLGKRSAEDMRFKARNMKETFLKGRSVLPTNFHFIVLDKKAIRKLHSLGIPYQQERIRGGAGLVEAADFGGPEVGEVGVAEMRPVAEGQEGGGEGGEGVVG